MAAHGISFGKPKIDLEALIGWKAVGRRQAHRRARGAGQAAQGRGDPRRGASSPVRTRSRSAIARSRFENCIIAAGSQAATLPGLPDDPRIIDSTGALVAARVPERLLVIGGGIIGLEMATVYDALGRR